MDFSLNIILLRMFVNAPAFVSDKIQTPFPGGLIQPLGKGILK